MLVLYAVNRGIGRPSASLSACLQKDFTRAVVEVVDTIMTKRILFLVPLGRSISKLAHRMMKFCPDRESRRAFLVRFPADFPVRGQE